MVVNVVISTQSEGSSMEPSSAVSSIGSRKRRMTRRRTMKNLARNCKLLVMENEMFTRYMKKIGITHFEAPSASIQTDRSVSNRRMRTRVNTQEDQSFMSGRILNLTAEQKCEIAQYEQTELKKEMKKEKDTCELIVGRLFAYLENYQQTEDAINKERRLFDRSVTSFIEVKTYPDEKSRAFLSFHRNYLRRLDELEGRLLRQNDRCQEILKKLSVDVLDKTAQVELTRPVDMQEIQIMCKENQRAFFQMNLNCHHAKALANFCTHTCDLEREKLDNALQEAHDLEDITKRKVVTTRRMNVGVQRHVDRAFRELRVFQRLNGIVDQYDAPEVGELIQTVSDDKELGKELVVSKRKMRVAKLRLDQHKRTWSQIKRQGSM